MSLSKIQTKLVAQKNQYNNFGKYKYRSLEDITDALKPHLNEFNYSLVVSDTIEEIGGRIYVKASAKLYDETMKVVAENTAYAREALAKKGMDESQITGAASSYARKYALNGLFAIDDTKDADSQDNNSSNETKATPLLINAKEINEISNLGVSVGLTVPQICIAWKMKSLAELHVENYDKMIEWINSQRKA